MEKWHALCFISYLRVMRTRLNNCICNHVLRNSMLQCVNSCSWRTQARLRQQKYLIFNDKLRKNGYSHAARIAIGVSSTFARSVKSLLNLMSVWSCPILICRTYSPHSNWFWERLPSVFPNSAAERETPTCVADPWRRTGRDDISSNIFWSTPCHITEIEPHKDRIDNWRTRNK